MTPETYNHARIVSGEISALDLYYLTLRWPEVPLAHAVRNVQRMYGLEADGMLGPRTSAAMPTRALRCDAESLIALALYATAGKRYRFGAETRLFERAHDYQEATSYLDNVEEWDCSEVVQCLAEMIGARPGRALADGTWYQYRQLAALRRAFPVDDARPGDLLFEFRDHGGLPVTPGDDRPARAHVGIVLNYHGWTVEAAPSGCGPHPTRSTWTHAARLLP